jgi:hypothetical protein
MTGMCDTDVRTATTERVDHRAFLDLVYQDDDSVRAEFDAIIAASWPPPPAPPAMPRPADRPPWWPPDPLAEVAPAPATASPRRWRSRQRSPPRREKERWETR